MILIDPYQHQQWAFPEKKCIPPVEDEVTVHNKLCFIVNIHKNKFIFPEKIPNEILLIIIIIYEFLYMIIRSK